jgi:uncharacterized protein
MASDAMSELLHGHLEAIRSLCREYGVSRLELFGSFARGDFEAGRSDVDLLVTFAPGTDLGPWMSRFFELRERLAVLLERDVDLVIESGLRNPYLIRSIDQDRRLLYAA